MAAVEKTKKVKSNKKIFALQSVKQHTLIIYIAAIEHVL